MAENLAISGANPCRGSTKRDILKNFAKFTEKDLYHSLFLKYPATLREELWHKSFPFNSEFF